jgi:hypothetical protein
VWYNETSQTMKVQAVTTAGAWANEVESWNGTAWTEIADIPQFIRQQHYGNNSTTSSG